MSQRKSWFKASKLSSGLKPFREMPLTVTAGAVSEASVSESEVSWLPAAGFPLKWEIVTAETAAKERFPPGGRQGKKEFSLLRFRCRPAAFSGAAVGRAGGFVSSVIVMVCHSKLRIYIVLIPG